MSNRWKVFVPAGVIVGYIGLVLTSGWLREFRRERAFGSALTTAGVVTGKRSAHVSSTGQTASSSDAHYVRFDYSVGRMSYHVEQNVIGPIYANVEKGSPVEVFYTDANPGDGVIEKPARSWVLLAAGAPLLIAGVGLLIAGISATRVA